MQCLSRNSLGSDQDTIRIYGESLSHQELPLKYGINQYCEELTSLTAINYN